MCVAALLKTKMVFPNHYTCLTRNSFQKEGYLLVPIRYEDRLAILNWRNEQLYHLRQEKPLTVEQQNQYFSEVVSALFRSPRPDQLLFSYLKNGECIGYGGLVHINWTDKNAEISFLVNSSILDNHHLYFECFQTYLEIIKQIGFDELKFNKLYTETYDLRGAHIEILEESGFTLEGRLREHMLLDGAYYDSLCHSILKREYCQSR